MLSLPARESKRPSGKRRLTHRFLRARGRYHPALAFEREAKWPSFLAGRFGRRREWLPERPVAIRSMASRTTPGSFMLP
jgi:hypothetical protein